MLTSDLPSEGSHTQRTINITYIWSDGDGTISGNISHIEHLDDGMRTVTDSVSWDSDYVIRNLEPMNDNSLFVGWVTKDDWSDINNFACLLEHMGDNDTIYLLSNSRPIINFQIQFMINDMTFFGDGTPNRQTVTFPANPETGANYANYVLIPEDLGYLSGGPPFVPNDYAVWWTHNGQSPRDGGRPLARRVAWTANAQPLGAGNLDTQQRLLPGMTFHEIMQKRFQEDNQFVIRRTNDPNRPGLTYRIYVHAFWAEP